MNILITASEKFVSTNPDLRGAYELGGTLFQGLKASFPVFQIPEMPFPISSLKGIYSIDGTSYVALFKGKSSAFFGSNGSLAKFPAKYTKTEGWTYEDASIDEISKKLGGEEKLSGGDFVGSLDVAPIVHSLIKLQLKNKKVCPKHHKAVGRHAEAVHFELYSSADGGVKIDFRLFNILNPAASKFEGEFYSETGRMAPGLKIVIDNNQFSSLVFLRQKSCEDVGLRVTKGTHENSAVLEWTSPSWDGAAFTTANIQSL